MSISTSRSKGTAPASPFEVLPRELCEQILELLSAERSRAIPACRLVCKKWRQLSSPYLIRTAVVAEGPRALEKLREIQRHPYFSKHVTHLLWDASYYDPRYLNDNNYSAMHVSSEHLTTYAITSSGNEIVRPNGPVPYNWQFDRSLIAHFSEEDEDDVDASGIHPSLIHI